MSFPFCVLYNDNLIILHTDLACRGVELSKQPIYRALPVDTEGGGKAERKSKTEKSVKDRQDV